MSKTKPDKPDAGSLAIRWREDVAEHDYAAAEAYLSLRFDERKANAVVAQLRASPSSRSAARTTSCGPRASSLRRLMIPA